MTPFETKGGLKGRVRVERVEAASALDGVWAAIDRAYGALLVSNYEVPNRYARWDIGFVHPPIMLQARGRAFTLTALNGEGERLLPLLAAPLASHPHVAKLELGQRMAEGLTHTPPDFFPEEERSRQPGFFSVVRALLDLLGCGQEYLALYGAMGFDLVFQFETLAQRMERHPNQVDATLFLPTQLVVVDRQKELAHRVDFDFDTPLGPSSAGGRGGQLLPPVANRPAGPQSCDHQPGEFERKVEQVRQGCRVGDYFEVVLSQTFSVPFQGTPTQVFRRICKNNPSPYSYLVNMGDEQLVGASPEMFVRVQGRRLETSPISGTVPVGESPMETADQIKALIGSEKEESELTMCTDVDRNDMTRVCVPGSVQLIGRRLIETYSKLVHTVDHVEGELAAGYDALDGFTTHLWAATVTGSPKPAALQTIEALENTPRRWYSGAVGYFGANGDLNSGMTLRTVHLQDGLAHVRAGATLLYDSDPALEERETRIKASAFLAATLGGEPAKPQPGGPARNRQTGTGKKVLFVDFRDSFVHTLASYVRQTGAQVNTVRANFPVEYLEKLGPDLIFLSPGPGSPSQMGVGRVTQLAVERNIPLFGVCLGHQGIAEHFGGQLGVLPTPVHGKPAQIIHRQQGILDGLPPNFTAARYHSLFVRPESLPDCLEATAHTADGVIMAMRHKTLPIQSVQFHPESILTLKGEVGHRLIENLFTKLLG